MKRFMNNANLYEVSCWVATSNTDTMEGRGTEYIIGHYDTEEEAKFHGKGRGVMGTTQVRRESIIVAVPIKNGYEQWDLASSVPHLDRVPAWAREAMQEQTQEDLRKRAMSKLSPKERKALGLP